MQNHPVVSIIIKALNEERRIARCLQSAVAEARSVQGEVILVDSLSTDRTVEVARNFDVRIVQFLNRSDANCGSAVQLGYQYSSADFVYVLDADMVFEPGFLALALAKLQAEPTLAGVGGKLTDTQVLTMADRRRVESAIRLEADHLVAELGGGALYRRTAVEQVGYLSNRWLAAYEEAELGVRLVQSGWKLMRLAAPAVLHEGHAETNVRMLARLWRNGRASATGVFIRSAIGKPWFFRVVRKLAHVFVVPVIQVGQFVVAGAAPEGERVLYWAGYWLVLVVLLTARKRSLPAALWSLLTWHYLAFAAIVGLARHLPSPNIRIAASELERLPIGRDQGRST
jgi:glycosyltransferase involved in cell wall biosynthesis